MKEKTEVQKSSETHTLGNLFPKVIFLECGHWTRQVCGVLKRGGGEETLFQAWR